MTLNEAIGVNSWRVEESTGKKLEHREFYSRVIELLGGLNAVIPFIPFSLETIKLMLERDEHMNSCMDEWIKASGFHANGSSCTFIGGGIVHLYRKAKITAFSCSEGVCILKEAARQWAEREESK